MSESRVRAVLRMLVLAATVVAASDRLALADETTVFEWREANGVTSYSQRPPPPGTRGVTSKSIDTQSFTPSQRAAVLAELAPQRCRGTSRFGSLQTPHGGRRPGGRPCPAGAAGRRASGPHRQAAASRRTGRQCRRRLPAPDRLFRPSETTRRRRPTGQEPGRRGLPDAHDGHAVTALRQDVAIIRMRLTVLRLLPPPSGGSSADSVTGLPGAQNQDGAGEGAAMSLLKR